MNITNDLIWIFLLTAILIFISYSKNKKPKIKKVIFFGDSLTEFGVQANGYISVMRQALLAQNIQNFDLIGAGISGNTVYDLEARMQDDVIKHSPDIVVIWIGANDVWQEADFSLSPSTEKFENVYRSVINQFKKYNYKLMLVTPAVIGEKKNNENPLDNNMEAYCEVIRNIAVELKIPLCDMRLIFQLYENRYNKLNVNKGILTIDGVHLNDAGNKLAATEILKVLNEM